jgi:hypothetical protein
MLTVKDVPDHFATMVIRRFIISPGLDHAGDDGKLCAVETALMRTARNPAIRRNKVGDFIYEKAMKHMR